MVQFDDGSGQALYCGTDRGVVRWRGSVWEPVGIDGPVGSVTALAVYDDGGGSALYAGGRFESIGGLTLNGVAKWDGVAWSVAGGAHPEADDTVYALEVLDLGSGPALYVGGDFGLPGLGHTSVARWNGAAWTRLPSPPRSGVLALAAFDDGGGPALYAGGYFAPTGAVAKFTGTAWQTVGQGVSGTLPIVTALQVFDDGSGPALFVGGYFTAVGDGVASPGVAKWAGSSWVPVGGGVGGTVHDLRVVHDGTAAALYAGGNFGIAGGLSARGIAKWNGSTWSRLSSGLGNQGLVYTIAGGSEAGQPVLYAGGAFSNSGTTIAYSAARWNFTSWSAIGDGNEISGTIHAFATTDDDVAPVLYAAGYLSLSEQTHAYAVARWDGDAWSAVGQSIGGPVLDIAIFDDGAGPAVYIAGEFDQADGQVVNNIAKWNGTAWVGLGTGMDGEVRALAVFDDGTGPALYAGGAFGTAGGVTADGLARWNGSVWEGVVSNMSGGSIHELLALDDERGPALIVAGDFFRIEGVEENIARWDGAAWSAMGVGLHGAVYALSRQTIGGTTALYAGGDFAEVGGFPAAGIARWDGANWTAVGGGVSGGSATVRAITTFDDWNGAALLAAGDFTTAGGVNARYVAKWDGTGWSEPGGGVDDEVYALAAFDDGAGPALFAGGTFAYAGPSQSVGIARWACPYERVDASGDGQRDLFDVDPFILALLDPGTYDALYPHADVMLADVNADGRVDNFDIDPFVACVLEQECP